MCMFIYVCIFIYAYIYIYIYDMMRKISSANMGFWSANIDVITQTSKNVQPN